MEMSRVRGTTMVLVVIVGALLLWNSNLSKASAEQRQTMRDKERVMLVGASIGQEWNLQKLPQRLKDDNHTYESVAAWQYDKTEALNEILMRPKRKFHFTRTYFIGFLQPAPQLPNIIIMKECASYFPGDLSAYQELMKKWVERIRRAQIQVVLATVVPVTHERAAKRAGQIEAIWKYNDWVREYAKKEGLVILDLEKSLRKSARERFLQDDLTSGDGQHLNKKAYDILDTLLVKTLNNKISMP
jgi:hypothetical protein